MGDVEAARMLELQLRGDRPMAIDESGNFLLSRIQSPSAAQR